MEFKEFSAKTVDEAITKACLDFETSSENLEIQVLFEGSSGFLGFGAKPARVNVRRKEVSLPEEPVIKEAVPVKEERKEEAKEEATADPAGGWTRKQEEETNVEKEGAKRET